MRPALGEPARNATPLTPAPSSPARPNRPPAPPPSAVNVSARSFQTAYYQRIRPDLWQISWVEETGTTVTIALDMEQGRITTFMSFSKGHWEHAEEAHGDKRDPEVLAM